MNFTKGSEWRKWDLHIHTPSSYFNTQYPGTTPGEKWKNYLNALETLEGISVLGITDYYSIEGYIKVKEYQDEGKLQNIDLLLPNVELRLLTSTYKDRPLNIHVIFDPSVLDDLHDHFFTQLTFDYNGSNYKCTPRDFERLGKACDSAQNQSKEYYLTKGAEQFKVTPDHLFKAIENHFNDTALIITPNSNNDGNSGFKNNSLQATRTNFYNRSHCIFSGNPKCREYFLGKGVEDIKDIVHKYGSLKPCVHGSDAHNIEKICKPNRDRFNWIKADPTFDGLKQILFEPEERVIIQSDSPALDIPYPHFSSLSFKGAIFDQSQTPAFQDTQLPLNSGLIAIIGGRGTGKSLLLDILKATLSKGKPQTNSITDLLSKIGTPTFTAILSKSAEETNDYHLSNESNPVDYLHVRQGEVKRIVEDKEKFAETILELLNVTSPHNEHGTQENISSELKEYVDIRNWLRKKDGHGNKIHSQRFLDKKIEQYELLKDTITTQDTKRKVAEYSSNSSKTSKIEILEQTLQALQNKIKTDVEPLNEAIEQINTASKHHSTNTVISAISISTQEKEIEKLINEINIEKQALSQKNSQIKNDLWAKGIKGDVSGILDKVSDYQQEIELAENLKKQNERKSLRTKTLLENRNKFAQALKEDFINTIISYKQKFEKLTKAEDLKDDHKEIINTLLKEITIEGELSFKSNQFYEGLWKHVNGRKISQDKFRKMFPVTNACEYFSLLANEKKICTENQEYISLSDFLEEHYEAIKNPLEFLNFLYLDEHRETFLKAIPTIKYYNKAPHQLSVGQRGTLYICIKLATSAFTTPFVFDQPEDDLDNSFIVKELTPIFRKIKKHRQLIIVTHNANLVVNADAEQVIVAQNNNETLSYFSGSLEDPDIRKEVCEILEGGEIAFKQRERRYGLA